MEKAQANFIVMPTELNLANCQEVFTLAVKNVGSRTCHYEVFVPDCSHFKINGDRTFSLAPGITKNVKIKHIKSGLCHCEEQLIEVIDTFGHRKSLEVICWEKEDVQVKKIEMPTEMKLQKMLVLKERIVEFPIKNVSEQNYRIKISNGVNCNLTTKVQIKIKEENFILLKNGTKIVRISFRMLEEAEISVTIYVEVIEETTKSKEPYFLRVTCDSLSKSQYILNSKEQKVDSISNSLLNGTSLKGSFLLENNYHEECSFKINEVIDVDDYSSYSQKIGQLFLDIGVKEGVIPPKSKFEIFYEVIASLTENDKSFISRYFQLPAKDDTYVYKLRNSKFFKKSLNNKLKIQFGNTNQVDFHIKNTVVNPALRINRTSIQGCQIYQILNDTQFEIPYKIPNNNYFYHKAQRNILKQGFNHIEIIWKQNQLPFSSSSTKQNQFKFIRSFIRMEIPQYELTLFVPVNQVRPKTAYLRQSRASMSKESLREKISIRAPSKVGEMGVRKFKEISNLDYMEKESRFIKHQFLSQEEFRYLQVNYNQKGYVLTNSHPNKNIKIFVQEKGYLLAQSCHSYLLPYEKKWLRIQHNGKLLQIKTRKAYDKQPYKIKNKELLFCFAPGQKQYEVIKEIEITNKSDENLVMHCLSVDDEFFHSMEPNHRLVIPPRQTARYKISFRPQSQTTSLTEKVTRQLQFLINDDKETIVCEGDFLPASIISDVKNLTFTTIPYSFEQIVKNITLTNRGIKKTNFNIQSSKFIRITPQSGVISERSKQILTVRFRPSQLEKNFYEQIKVQFKGSHVLRIPLKVSTKQPDIYCAQQCISFGTGYVNQMLKSSITVVNHNAYPCTINIKLSQIENIPDQQFVVDAESTKNIDVEINVREVGEKIVKLSPNFIELKGYGTIRGPRQYRLVGKQTILQLVPDHAFKDIQCSLNHETKNFILKNLSEKTVKVNFNLEKKCNQDVLLMSCQTTNTEVLGGTEKEFSLYSIRTDEQNKQKEIENCKYKLSIWINNQELYRTIDFSVKVPPPQLEIFPQEIYFPLSSVNSWSTAFFSINNLGYKEVFVAIRKPTNIAFDLEADIEDGDNKLTKLKNSIDVRLSWRSKKAVSFSVILVVENNFGKKYEIKLYGTTSRSPLLRCDRGIDSSTVFSSSQIRSVGSMSAKSIPFVENLSEEPENFKFFSKLVHGIFPESAKRSEFYNSWLKKPANLVALLEHIKINLSLPPLTTLTLEDIIDELKKQGYPVYTVKKQKLMEANRNEWSNFLWFILSNNMIHEDCLKWVNKMCGLCLETYDNAYNHQKKILIDLLSKILEPIYKSKVTDYNRILEIFSPSIPILTSIDSKRQFILLLNFLYLKFSKAQVQTVNITHYNYNITLPGFKTRSNCWILSNNSFSPEISGNYNEDIYLPDKKLLSFTYTGQPCVSLKFKQDSCVALWNNQYFDPLKLYKINLQKKVPVIHNIVIESEDQFSQQWNLDFVCNIESEYFYQFFGGDEFKCRTPEPGVIKAGSIMKFTIIYSPTDLKDHQGILKVSNKFEEHVYNLKGKPLRSRNIEMEVNINIPQGQKFTSTLGIEDTDNSESPYIVKELDKTTEEMKSCQAKSNSKEIMITTVFEYEKVIQNQMILLQVTNKEGTFCRNVRLIVSVIPRAKIIQASFKGIIGKTTVEKIPITNIMTTKQRCTIKLLKISKDLFESVNYGHLNNDNSEEIPSDWDFNISCQKMMLGPKQKASVFLSYLPTTFEEAYCQIRIKYEDTQQLIVINYQGIPDLPSIENKLMQINCQMEKQTYKTIKISNKVKQYLNFEVQTNINFIAGAQEITLAPRESHNYQFKIIPMHEGEYYGQLLFKNAKFCLRYPLFIKVRNMKNVQTLSVSSKVRVSSTISFDLKNKADKSIQYQVFCESQCLQYPSIITIPPRSQVPFVMKYLPLYVGTKAVELRLFNEKANQIIYLIQMTAEQNLSEYVINCELGQPKKFKINLKNPTNRQAQIQAPNLPVGLDLHQSNHFPLTIPGGGSVSVEMIYTQQTLKEERQFSFGLMSDSIGRYCYKILFTSMTQKILPTTLIEYQIDDLNSSVMYKEWSIEVFNPFEQNLHLNIPNKQIQYDDNIKIYIESKEDFFIKPFDKKIIKCRAELDFQNTKNHKKPKNNQIIFNSAQFKWIYPITFVQIKSIPKNIEIIGPSHQYIRVRVTLKNLKSVKQWEVIDIPDFDKLVKTSRLSSNDLYLEAVVNKNLQYQGFIKYYEEDMTCAQKYPLIIKIGGRKIKPVTIEANVGQKSVVKIKVKNGKGKYRVDFKNNKRKEFRVYPLEGVFTQNGENLIHFEYSPVQYNGTKKAEVSILSEEGNFEFSLNGKFPSVRKS